jgi:hypothetical protein
MRTGIETLAGLAILANAVIYGTDVFGALVLCPAVGVVDDRTLTQAMGHIHRIADRRLPTFSVGGLIAAVGTTALAAAGGRWVSCVAAALATLALVLFAVVYTRVSKPINVILTAAAFADRVPNDVRQLEARWDSVINARVALQTIALAALCVGVAAA